MNSRGFTHKATYELHLRKVRLVVLRVTLGEQRNGKHEMERISKDRKDERPQGKGLGVIQGVGGARGGGKNWGKK